MRVPCAVFRAEEFGDEIREANSLKFTLARDTATATKRDWWLATSKAVQSLIVERMIATAAVHNNRNAKRIYYLSLKFCAKPSLPLSTGSSFYHLPRIREHNLVAIRLGILEGVLDALCGVLQSFAETLNGAPGVL